MSKPNLKTIRSKTGLTEAQFLKKLRPALKRRNSLLTPAMLKKLENGERLREDRMDEVISSIQEAFPEFSETVIAKASKKNTLAMSPKHLLMMTFAFTTVVTVGLYYYFDLKDVVNETLTLVASVAGVLGLIFTIYKATS